MGNFLSLAALLSIFAWAEGEAGPRTPRAASFLALLALLAIVLSWAAPRRPFRRADVVRFLAAILFAAMFHGSTGPMRFFALATCLGVGIAERSAREPLARTLPIAALVFAGFLAVRDHLSLWVPIAAAADAMSERIAAALHGAASFGPTRVGAWTALGGVALAVASAVTLGARARITTALAAVLFVLVSPAAVALELLGRPPFAASWPHPVAPPLALLLCAAPLALLARVHASAVSTGPVAPRPRVRLGVVGALALMGLLLLVFSRGYDVRRTRVLLDTRGGFGMEPLQWGHYGPDAPQGASLASLPDLLEAYHFELTRSDSAITPELLSRHDVLFVMNPTKEYTPEEHDAIWRFVQGGGGLLVLGDHTNILGTGNALRALLAPVSIHVRFDSAIPAVERWTWYGCMRTHPHPALRDVHDETDVKISVGASLAIHGDALPLITGRDAFSDAGDSTNARGAYLGNMRQDPSERFGDLVLAAEAPYGRGKIIVFGDTSTFQRSAVTFSRGLVLRVLTYLGTPGHATPSQRVRAVGAGLFVAAGAAFLAALPGATGVAALSAVAMLMLAGVDRFARVALPAPETVRVAWVDLAHGNRVDIHAGREDGIGGLCDHLVRDGYLPLAMKHFDARELRGSPVFASVAPAFPFSREERRALGRFVNDGGLLIVATGFEESRGAAGLLADFGFSIGATPLGAAHESKSALEGTVITMKESWPVITTSKDAVVLAEAWGYPLVALQRVGRGSVLVIGDSRFLGERMLESPEQSVPGNIQFLRRAIERARAGASEPTS